jgi:serine/threonine-protein kinase
MSDTLRTTDTIELDLSGQQLGDYRILRRLGRGGMADVYLAEQSSLRRQVALKVLKRELANDETYVRRFHLEAQAAAALVHANIVQIYEVGCVEGHHYIAQEYVQGQNLRELMTRHGLPELKLALSILRQVTSALARAAEQGVVHRDIKPENIMLTRGGEVKVADFGLARISGNGDALNLTQVGITMGTPLYMSPEQVEGRPLDTRSDLYSLGVTSYHMLAGEPPFRGDTALAVAIQHVRSDAGRLEALRPDLPTGLCHIIHKMMAKQPEQRYQHPRDVLRELRSLQTQSGDAKDAGTSAEWSVSELMAMGDAPVALTHELDGLMKTQTLLASNTRWIKNLVAAAVVAFLLGGLVAYLMREPFLLLGNETTGAIPEQDTIKAQHEYALLSGNNVAAWEAVLKYHPEDDTWAPSAKQNLAGLYLQRDDYELALPLLKQLEETRGDTYRAFGLAGQAVIFAIQGNDEFRDKLVKLRSLTQGNPTLLNAHMTRLVSEIYEKTLAESEEEASRAVEELIYSLDTKSSGKKEQK